MDKVGFKIVIKKVERPLYPNPVAEMDWLCQSLGFYEKIDREKTASTVFKEVIRGVEEGTPLNSTELAERIGMSRGAVINHLNNLITSGLVLKHGRSYYPRSRSLLRTIEEIEDDVERIFQKMKKTAREIDDQLGIKWD